MNIQAEIIPTITAVPEQIELTGAEAVIEAGDLHQIALQLLVGDVHSYVRHGDDLMLVLVNGEKIILVDFFRVDEDGEPILALVSETSDCFVEITFADSNLQGILEPLASDAACMVGVAASAFPLPLAILAVLGAGAAVAAAANDDDDKGGNGHGKLPKPIVDPTDGDKITGKAEKGATVIIKVVGENEVYTTLADEEGNWSYDFQPDKKDETAIDVKQEKGGKESDTVRVIVDNEPPPMPEIDPTNGKMITGSAGGDAVEVELRYTVDGKEEVHTVAVKDGRWSYDPQPDLPAGTVIRAWAYDSAKNKSLPDEETVDTTLPDAPNITKIADDTGTYDDDFVTKDKELFIHGDGAQEGDVIHIYIDGVKQPGSAVAGSNGQWSFPWTASGDGNYKATATVTRDGKTSLESAERIITIDTNDGGTRPTGKPTIDRVEPDNLGGNDDFVTTTRKPKFFGTAEKDAQVTVYWQNMDDENNPGPLVEIGTVIAANGAWSIEVGSDFAIGQYRLLAEQRDSAGNAASARDEQAFYIIEEPATQSDAQLPEASDAHMAEMVAELDALLQAAPEASQSTPIQIQVEETVLNAELLALGEGQGGHKLVLTGTGIEMSAAAIIRNVPRISRSSTFPGQAQTPLHSRLPM